VAGGLLLGGSGCAGDQFEAVSRKDDASIDDASIDDASVGNDAGPRDSTSTDAGDVRIDAGPRDSTSTDAGDVRIDAAPRDSTSTDAVDVGSDVRPRDSTLPDATPDDAAETGVQVDVVVPPDTAAGDALPDLRNEAAAPDADTGPTAWCMGRWALFCADFDSVTAVSDGWTTASVTPGAVLDFNLVDFTSPHRSLHGRLPAGGGSEMASARLAKVVSTSLSRSVLEFDCNVASIGAASGDWLLQIGRLGRNGSESAVALLALPTGKWSVLVTTSQPVFSSELPAPPKYGTFVRVSMEVVWSVTAGSVTVSFDGVTVLARDAIATAVAATTSSVDLTVGPFEAIRPTPPAELSFDNVVLR
jgi:hypothetical protein